MRALMGEAMLQAWERSRALPRQEGALAMLSVACPEYPMHELASLPLGERNALLLEVRAITLGRRIEGFAVCPECGAQLEFVLDASELAKGLGTPPAEDVEDLAAAWPMRPANTLDMLASSTAGNEEQARSILLARTLGLEDTDPETADAKEPKVSMEWLLAQPDPLPSSLMERFEQLNASAEIRVQLQCAACLGAPVLDLDISDFLLREIGAAARRLFAEIHELASAYGWSERSITAMSGARRAAYLEMLSA
ncbi:MAG TPA: hypothetical protein VG225_03470 [Terracidiphilus sp.]|jgi:hypothetical protein|nr:hypothetical protein [Terracidiphilus sp.]